jgi:outer membrane lipoprotein-sorting protein
MSRNMMVGLLGVLAGVGLMAADAWAFSVSYDQKMTRGREVYQSKVLLKDKLFRMEMTVGGQTSIVIHNAEGTYTVIPSQGMAMKTPNSQPGQQPVQGADDYVQYLQQQHAERIGSEMVNGHDCDIYRFTDPEAKGTTTAWVWKDKMFPIKIEMETPDGKMLVELSNIQLGGAIPDSAFQLPAGVKVMDIGSMIGTP